MRALSRVSDVLAESYRALAERAERVEEELGRTHAELERVLESRAALGNMAGGIAHELRNPMNAVKGFAALLAPRLPEGSREREWAAHRRGRHGGRRDPDQHALAGRPGEPAGRDDRREALLDEAIGMATRDMAPASAARPAGERWIIASGCTLDSFAGDRIKLRQALRNLIANALQAQPDGGERAGLDRARGRRGRLARRATRARASPRSSPAASAIRSSRRAPKARASGSRSSSAIARAARRDASTSPDPGAARRRRHFPPHPLPLRGLKPCRSNTSSSSTTTPLPRVPGRSHRARSATRPSEAKNGRAALERSPAARRTSS